MQKVVILHNIRSTHNVGSIFRTSDAVGVDTIFITGYTPTPIDKYGRERKDIAKTALGAQKSIKWSHKKNIILLIEKLQKEGFTIIAIEQDDNSMDYKKVNTFGEKVAFILGNEVRGLSKTIKDHADIIAEVPMAGVKESLNVAVTAGIVLFRILDK